RFIDRRGGRAGEDARAVDENVDWLAERVVGGGSESLGCPHRAVEIDSHEPRPAGTAVLDLLHHLGAALRIAPADHDICSLGAEGDRDRSTDVAGRTGDQRSLAV